MAIADNMPNDRPGDLVRRIADLERAMRELRAARNLDQATITPEPGIGIRTGDFDGTDFAHPGTVGNYFGGDGLVANSLYLRPGSISNDELTNPLEKKRIRNSATNYAVPSGSFTQVCSVNATVPDGFTGVMAIANGYNFVRNTNTTGGSNGAGGNLVYTLVGFGGLFTDAEGWPLSGGGGFTGSGVSVTFDITGLTGGDVLTLSLLVGVGYDTIPADSLTRGFVSAGLFWFR